MRQALTLIALLIILLLPVKTLATQDHIEYNLTINKDASATWQIIQVSDINSTIDSLEQFQQRILNAINTARESTNRDMALDFKSLEMKTDMHWETSSQTIEYIFLWENFSTTTNGKITFGDVFSRNFFSSFYGDGELYVTYPTEYNMNSASPYPDEHNNSTQTLHWYRTQELPASQSSITLKVNYAEISLPLTMVAITISGALGAIAAGFLVFNYRKQRKKTHMQTIQPPPWKEIQSNEEKILQLIKSSGGSVRQSEICNKLRFSRAKTSLLLTEMEKNSQVRRDKKGKNNSLHNKIGSTQYGNKINKNHLYVSSFTFIIHYNLV